MADLATPTEMRAQSDPRNLPDVVQPIVTPDGLSRSESKTWLKNLLRAESMSDPQAQKAIAMLRKLEGLCGPYVLASDIVNHMRSLSNLDSVGESLGKDAGYGFAAELMIKHAYVQLEAIEQEGRFLGPSIFRGYCTEIVDALFMRRNARKGTEAIVTMTDWLVAKASEQGEHWALYLELADQAMTTLIDLSTVKAEAEERRERAVARALRQAGERQAGESAAPMQKYVPAIDQELMVNLRNLQRKQHAVRLEFEKIMKEFRARYPQHGESNGESKTVQRIAFLQTLLRVSAAAEYHAFSGLLSERLGALCERAERGTGLKLVRSAASYFELQGDKDAALRLKSLARERYKRAVQLYNFAKDPASIERINEKVIARKTERATVSA